MAVAEIIPGRLFFSPLEAPLSGDPNQHYFSVDHLLEYNPFHLDFGPLNLGLTYRFCQLLNAKLNSQKLQNMRIHYYCSSDPQKIANAVCLIGIFQIVSLHRSASESYQPLSVFEPFVHFNDASMHGTTYRLYPIHVLNAMETAIKHKWFSYDTFDVGEYLYYEQVEHGDLNVIIPRRFIAFASPYDNRYAPKDYPTFTPQAYLPIFRNFGVVAVVRLNDKLYDKRGFTQAGVAHHDLFFEDGSNPSPAIIERFLTICRQARGAIAIHCKAGLGRTGTLIAIYMMATYGVDAATCIAWLRLCRPGSVIGQQQHFLAHVQDQYLNRYVDTPAMPAPVPSVPTTRSARSASPYKLAQPADALSRPRTRSSLALSSGPAAQHVWPAQAQAAPRGYPSASPLQSGAHAHSLDSSTGGIAGIVARQMSARTHTTVARQPTATGRIVPSGSRAPSAQPQPQHVSTAAGTSPRRQRTRTLSPQQRPLGAAGLGVATARRAPAAPADDFNGSTGRAVLRSPSRRSGVPRVATLAHTYTSRGMATGVGARSGPGADSSASALSRFEALSTQVQLQTQAQSQVQSPTLDLPTTSSSSIPSRALPRAVANAAGDNDAVRTAPRLPSRRVAGMGGAGRRPSPAPVRVGTGRGTGETTGSRMGVGASPTRVRAM